MIFSILGNPDWLFDGYFVSFLFRSKKMKWKRGCFLSNLFVEVLAWKWLFSIAFQSTYWLQFKLNCSKFNMCVIVRFDEILDLVVIDASVLMYLKLIILCLLTSISIMFFLQTMMSTVKFMWSFFDDEPFFPNLFHPFMKIESLRWTLNKTFFRDFIKITSIKENTTYRPPVWLILRTLRDRKPRPWGQ